MPLKRRFIAGAVCPECGAMDRIQRCEDGARLWMECVACGMWRDLDAAKGGLPQEAAETQQDKAEVQPVAVLWKKPD